MPKRSKKSLSTDRQILGAKPPENGRDRAEYRIEGTPGLVLRVTATAAKSWGYWAKDPQTLRWRMQTLGTYPAMTLARARAEAQRIKLALVDGHNPFAGSQRLPTLAEIADEYVKRHARPKKRSADEDERKLKREVIPELGAHLASEVTTADIVRLLDKISDRGAGIAANRTLALLRKLYNWAVAEGYVADNPAARIPMRVREEPRTRVLSDEELSMFWQVLDGPGFDPVTADALRLQLLLGARIREITDMTQDELKLEADPPTWQLPRERAKGGRNVVRPLPSLAVEIIGRRLQATQSSSYVFASPVDSSKPIRPTAPGRAVYRAANKGLVTTGWAPHDLRRTCRTNFAKLGISETVAKKILGHTPPRSDVTASVYDQHSYLPEMMQALEAWQDHLLDVVASKEAVATATHDGLRQ